MTAAKPQKNKSQKQTEKAEPRVVPVYLPSSNPPRRRFPFLMGMAVLAVIWIGLLAYFALQQVGAI